MIITKCDICKNENLIKSEIIPDLYYCIKCDNFLYYGDNTAYSIQQVLRAVGKVFPDLILNVKSLGVLADLCVIKDNFLEIYANIIQSDILEINTLKQDIKSEKTDSLIMSYSHVIEQSLKIDYGYCEYIIRIIIYALGLDLPIEEPVLDDKSNDSSIIRLFKQSTNKVLKGSSVEFSWDVRLKHSSIKLQIGDKVSSIKNPRYSKRINIVETVIVTLIVENRKNHQELARKQLRVIVVDPVEILEFTPSRYISIESSPIHLKWIIKNADKVVLLPTQQDVTSKSCITVHPVVSTTYIIKASNECSSIERSCSISVKKIPSISHVSVSTPNITHNYRIKIRMPNVQINRIPINISIGNIKTTPTISYILPFPKINKKKVISFNIKCKWLRKVKSLLFYFEKIYKYYE